MSQLSQDELIVCLKAWKSNPLLGIKSLFGVTPDKQQEELIKCCSKEKVRTAVKSCQGGGKTATLTWLTILFLLTLDDCRILITSPSYNQLSRVYYTEIVKWHSKMPQQFQDMFEITKETIYVKTNKSQVANLVTANPSNVESLQGGHSENYVVLADEASGIDNSIYELLLGTLGVGKTKFIATSNPVKSYGFFYDIFSKKLKNWDRLTFTAQESGLINPDWIEEIADTYGKDSDAYKIRVLGKFGDLSEEQFIPTNLVNNAVDNNLPIESYHNYPKVVGADIARYGVDDTVFITRQGPKILDIVSYSGLNTMEVAMKLAEYRQKITPSVMYIDGIGIGAGVVDRCIELGLPVKDVVVSNKSSNPRVYSNLRAQLWGAVRDWLRNAADIPNMDELRKDLVTMTYSYARDTQIQMTSKKDIKRRGERSPDYADALCLTFADEVYKGQIHRTLPRMVQQSNYSWA